MSQLKVKHESDLISSWIELESFSTEKVLLKWEPLLEVELSGVDWWEQLDLFDQSLDFSQSVLIPH